MSNEPDVGAPVEEVSPSAASPERFDPGQDAGKLVHAEHVTRYAWAATLASGRDVLDAGSGTGYGTEILFASAPASLSAVDLDPEAVEATRTRVGGSQASVGDVRDLPFDDDAFDLVVCFEVIEHVTEPERALGEFARVLRPDGLLVLSSPHRGVYMPGNPHHVREFTPQELEDALRAHFANVRMAGQHTWLSTVAGEPLQFEKLTSGIEIGARLLGESDAAQERDPTFLLAVAGNAELPPMPPLIALADSFEAAWWQDQVDAARDRADEAVRAAQVARSDHERAEELWSETAARLIDSEQEIGLLKARVAWLETGSEGVEALSRALAQAMEQLQDAQRALADTHASVSWRLTKPIRGVRRLLRR